jgi:hypothetical protein
MGMRSTNERTRSLGSTLAFTLVEVLWAAVLIATGVTATVKAVNGAKRSGLSAQRTGEASKIAAAEIEQLKAYSYKSLGMTSNVTGGSAGGNLPTGDCARFLVGSSPSYTNCPTGTTVASALQVKVGQHSGGTAVNEDLVEPVNGGIDGDAANTSGPAGLVPTTAKNVSVGGDGNATNFRVYRYATWHDEVCDYDADNTLSTEDDCTGKRNTKTLLVGVEPRDASGGPINAGEPGPNNVVWVSAVVADPAEGSGVNGCANVACGTTSRLTSQVFYLYDTTCDHSSRQSQSESHATHLTTAQSVLGWATGTKNVSACKNASPPSGSDCRFPVNDPWTAYAEASTKSDSRCIPDLMGPAPIPPTCETCDVADPFRYSADVWAVSPSAGSVSTTNWPQRWGYGPASALLQRTAGCPSSAPPTNPTGGSSINAASIHTWATDELASSKFLVSTGNKGFYVSGRMALKLYVGSYDPAGAHTTGKGKLCITLIDRDEGSSTADPWANDKIIYQFTCEIKKVPLGANRRWSSSQAKSNNEDDWRSGKAAPVRRSCRFNPGYGQSNWTQNYLTSTKSQIFPPPTSDPAAPNAAYGAPACQKTSGGGPGIIDNDGDGYDDYGYLVCNGHRLLLRISAIAADATALGTNGSVNDIALYYDHEVNPSQVQITTVRKTLWDVSD